MRSALLGALIALFSQVVSLAWCLDLRPGSIFTIEATNRRLRQFAFDGQELGSFQLTGSGFYSGVAVVDGKLYVSRTTGLIGEVNLTTGAQSAVTLPGATRANALGSATLVVDGIPKDHLVTIDLDGLALARFYRREGSSWVLTKQFTTGFGLNGVSHGFANGVDGGPDGTTYHAYGDET